MEIQKRLARKYCKELLKDIDEVIERIKRDCNRQMLSDASEILEDAKMQITLLTPIEED